MTRQKSATADQNASRRPADAAVSPQGYPRSAVPALPQPDPMLSFASLLLIIMAAIMAVLVAWVARALLRGERMARARPAHASTGERGRHPMDRWVGLT